MGNLRNLVGAGNKIMLFALPVLIVGVVLNVLFPSFFSVGGPAPWLALISLIVLVAGVIIWIWSVVLILDYVPKARLITSGPYTIVKHPLYVGVSLLVIPWLGFLLNTWLGVVIGLAIYLGSRRYAPDEERILARNFGTLWEQYSAGVKIRWL